MKNQLQLRVMLKVIFSCFVGRRQELLVCRIKTVGFMICYDTDYHNEKRFNNYARVRGAESIFPLLWKMLIEIVFPDNDMNSFCCCSHFHIHENKFSLILRHDNYNNIYFKAT